MKTTLFSLLLIALVFYQPVSIHAQSTELLDNVWKKVHADDPDFQAKFGVALRLHVSDRPVVNAWTTPETGDIFISKQLLNLNGSSEGELAFVVAHEIGHVIGYHAGFDNRLQQAQIQSDLRSLLSRLGLIFQSQQEVRNRYIQIKETLADTIGLAIIDMAGYSPYDAGGFFGRLQMHSGTTSPNDRLWNQYRFDHPFNEDRIDNLRQVMTLLADQKSTGSAPREVAYVWIGKFKVTSESASGAQVVMDTTDALGIYTESDFAAAQDMEVEARKELIKRFMLLKYAGKITRITDVTLATIEKRVIQ